MNANVTPAKDELFELVVDDGYKAYPIKNLVGMQIGTLYFNPTDFNIVGRFNEHIGELQAVLEGLDGASINPDGSGGDEDAQAILEGATAKLEPIFNEILGGNFFDAFFAKTSPFAITQGNFYVENAVEVLANLITNTFGEETKKIDKRVKKYTEQYEKVKAKQGKTGK